MTRPYWILLLFTACSPSAPPEMPSTTDNVKATIGPQATIDITRDRLVNTAEFSASRERVWNALSEAHEAIGIPFESGDPKAGSVTFAVHDRSRTIAGRAASSYINCGQGSVGDRADTYRITVKVHHAITENGMGLTTLNTSIDATARNPGLSGDPVPCSSRGTLERQIAGLVSARLK